MLADFKAFRPPPQLNFSANAEDSMAYLFRISKWVFNDVHDLWLYAIFFSLIILKNNKKKKKKKMQCYKTKAEQLIWPCPAFVTFFKMWGGKQNKWFGVFIIFLSQFFFHFLWGFLGRMSQDIIQERWGVFSNRDYYHICEFKFYP